MTAVTTLSPATSMATPSATMTALVRRRYGGTDTLQVQTVRRPVPREGEVLLEVAAAGLDRGTWHLMTGRPYLMRLAGFGFFAPRQPVLGMEVSGTVVEVAAGVTRWSVGDRVFGYADGAFAPFAVARADKLAAAPTHLPLEEAALLAISGSTALQAMTDGGAKAGERVLIVGASGGVGTYAVQIAKALGLHVTAVCSAAKAFQSLRVLVPSRAFAIDYEVVGERFLPLVEEFLLRTIAVAGSLDAKVAGQFLGLSERECVKTLDVLQHDGLILMDSDGRWELSAYARERLRYTDGVPRFVEVESKQTIFAVDLISLQAGPTTADLRGVWREHAIELQERPRSDGRQLDHVRAAFEDSFYETYRGTPRRNTAERSAAKAQLHRVQNIVGRRYFSWPFNVDVVARLSGSLQADFPFGQYTQTAEIEARRDLFNAIRTSIAKVTPPIARPTLPDAFLELLHSTPAKAAIDGQRVDERFLLELGLKEVGTEADPVFFVGDFSQQRVDQLWGERLRASGARASGAQPLIWLPPEGGLWARSEAVRIGLETTRTVMREREREMVAALLVPCGPDGSPRTVAPQRHKEAFSVARSANTERWPSNVEVVVVNRQAAAVFFHMRPNGDCVVPVVCGFMTIEKTRVEAIETLMRGLLNPAPTDARRDWCQYEDGLPDELAEALRCVIGQGA